MLRKLTLTAISLFLLNQSTLAIPIATTTVSPAPNKCPDIKYVKDTILENSIQRDDDLYIFSGVENNYDTDTSWKFLLSTQLDLPIHMIKTALSTINNPSPGPFSSLTYSTNYQRWVCSYVLMLSGNKHVAYTVAAPLPSSAPTSDEQLSPSKDNKNDNDKVATPSKEDSNSNLPQPPASPLPLSPPISDGQLSPSKDNKNDKTAPPSKEDSNLAQSTQDPTPKPKDAEKIESGNEPFQSPNSKPPINIEKHESSI